MKQREKKQFWKNVFLAIAISGKVPPRDIKNLADEAIKALEIRFPEEKKPNE